MGISRPGMVSKVVQKHLDVNANHEPSFLHPPHQLPLFGTPGVRIDAQYCGDPRLVMVLAAAHFPSIRASTRTDRSVSGIAVLAPKGRSTGGVPRPPGLLQHRGVSTVAIIRRDFRPEGALVSHVHGVETRHVNGLSASHRGWGWQRGAV